MAEFDNLTPEEEEFLAEFLQDLADVSGVSLEEIMASQFEEPEPDIPEGYVLGDEGTMEDEFDSENDWGDDIGDYFDEFFDDLDVDQGESDAYAENPV